VLLIALIQSLISVSVTCVLYSHLNMAASKLFRISLLVGNSMVIILAVIILSLSVHRWNEYVGGGISIFVSIAGLLVSCVSHPMSIMGYSILVIVDFLILLANAIIITVHNVNVAQYCFEYRDDFASPHYGCDDYRHRGYNKRAIGVMVCLFLCVIIRVLNFACAALLARIAYSGVDDEGNRLDKRERQY